MHSFAVFTICALVATSADAINLTTATVKDVQDAIQSGKCTCRQIIQGYLERINAYNRAGPMIGGIISTNPNALLDAMQLDNYYAQNRRLIGILHCAPLIAKDNIDAVGLPSTSGVHAFRFMYPKMDATIIQNAKRAGAVFIGKANQSPMSSMESWGNSETGGLIRNPYGLPYTSYGSSGGNGASGAAMFTILGYGCETGVSINLPSSAANLVGVRPPVSLISPLLDGVLGNSKPQDVCAPMAKTVEDVALLLDAEVGNFQTKKYSAPEVLKVDGLRGARINIFKLFAYDEVDVPNVGRYKVDPQVINLFNNMVNNMVNAGATVRNITTDVAVGLSNYGRMSTLETESCLTGWRNEYFSNPQRFDFTAPFHNVAQVVQSNSLPPFYQTVWAKFLNASSTSKCNEDLQKYMDGRQKFIDELLTPLLNDADAAIWPAMPNFPLRMGADAYRRDWSTPAPPEMINFINAGSWSAYSTINVPLGFSQPLADAPDGLPNGAIMIAKPENFEKLLTIAFAYQKNYGISKVPYSVPELPQRCCP